MGVKENITKRDDIKRHSNAITIWQTSAEVTALLHSLRLEMNGVQEMNLS